MALNDLNELSEVGIGEYGCHCCMEILQINKILFSTYTRFDCLKSKVNVPNQNRMQVCGCMEVPNIIGPWQSFALLLVG